MATATILDVSGVDVLNNAIMKGLDECMVRSITNTFGNHEYFRGLDLQKTITVDGVKYDFTSTHFKAWILEYGSGIYTDEQRNPYFEEYKNSILYEDARGNYKNKIVGRGDKYTQLDYDDGKTVREYDGYMAKGVVLDDYYQEQWSEKPKPFLQNLIKECWENFCYESQKLLVQLTEQMPIMIRSITT